MDPDDGTTGLLARYPDEMGGRANDACADLDGNLVTGKLNLGPGEGSAWWYSAAARLAAARPRHRQHQRPAAGVLDGQMTLVIGDTSAHYYAYPYEPAEGSVGPRRVFGDMTDLAGGPDGSTLDAHGGLWCALYGGGQLVRFTAAGLDRTAAPAGRQPHRRDVRRAGPRPPVRRVGRRCPDGDGDGLDGALLVIDGLEVTGRPEPRFSLA